MSAVATLRSQARQRWAYAAMALVAYVPLLLTERGTISADTKAYLYLDPGGFTREVGNMWNTHVAAGTVTHQNIGYLFPLGPYYWLLDTVGVPTWVAQRLWFGSLLFAAGAGTCWMLGRLGVRRTGAVVGGFVYMLSPYLLAYMGRTSVILMPWAALPWLVGLVHAALRERSWRAPALVAIVITLVAGTNASSVVFVMLGPALLLPVMIWGTREVTGGDALRAVGRMAVTTAPAQLWWVAGLWVQGSYGLPILQLTESLDTVAQTATAPELLRGLGYWYFYGRDGVSQWTQASTLYTQDPGMLALGFVLPALGLASAFLVRWRYRAYMVALVALGLVLGIGTYPFDSPSPFGQLLKLSSGSAAGFALRNSPRAAPLLVLGLAALVASGTDAFASRVRTAPRPVLRSGGLVAALAVVAVALLGLPPLWTGELVQRDLEFPSEPPEYWQQAAAAIDAGGTGTRVLELPGSDFAAYRWGSTQDPVAPGLIDRPWIGRELTAYGTPGTVNLVQALDRRLQEGVGDTRAVAPVARLLSASDVLLRMDTQYERYRAPRPADLWSQFGQEAGTDGLGPATTFGPLTRAVADARQPTLDEQELARPTDDLLAPPLALYPVDDARPMVRTEPVAGSTVVWGDGEGLVDMAEAGMVPDARAVLYAATLAGTDAAGTVRAGSPSLVVTDSNRRRAERWGTTRENYGATEAAGSTALEPDTKDFRLEVFPDDDDAQRSVADYGPDVADVRATSYGNIVAYSAEARPVNALDGDPRTAWSTGGYSEVVGERLQVELREPVTTDHVELSQLSGDRVITGVTVALDGEDATSVELGPPSFSEEGQRIDLGGPRTFTTLEVTIDSANVADLQSFFGWSNVGIRELRIPGVEATEWIRVPDAGLDDWVDPATPLDYLFSRWRANAVEGFRQDPELALARIFSVPEARAATLTGEARLGGRADGARLDELLGRPGLDQGYAVVRGDDYLSGALALRPSSLLDGDTTTAWTLGFGEQVGRGVAVELPGPTTVDHLDLAVVADGEHSVPTALTLVPDDGVARTVPVPAIEDGTEPGATTTVTVPVEPFTTTQLRVEVGDVRAVVTPEYFSGDDHVMPVAIAELGLPATVGPLPERLPDTCHTGLLQLDGVDVPVRLDGTVADAVDRQPLAFAPCDGATPTLDAGEHRVLATPGLDSGIDLDRVRLATTPPALTPPAGTPPAGGDVGGEAAAVPVADPAGPADEVAAPPEPTVERTGELSYRVDVQDAEEPFWLVLGQSLSPGWSARVVDGPSLGEPMLVDGFANGWSVDPAVVGSSFTVELVWTPQRVVWAAVAISAAWFLGVVALAVVATLRSRRRPGRRVRHRADWEPFGIGLAASDELPLPLARVGAAVGMGALGWLVGGPVVGLALLVLTGVAGWLRRGRLVLAAGTVVSLGAVVVVYVGYQVRRAYRPGVEWPAGFGVTHQLVLVAVLSVVADVVLRGVALKWPQRAHRARAASQSSDGSALTR